jgi:hypothetical protein
MHDAEMKENVGVPASVTEVDEQLVSLVKHLLRPPKVPPQAIHDAEMAEGDCLPEPVTEVGEQLAGFVEHLLRPPEVPSRVVHAAEVGEGRGLAEPVVGAYGGGQRGVVDVVRLVPGADGPQVVVQGGGQRDDQIGMSGRLIEARGQGGQFGIQPGPCPLRGV